jgi:acyl-ACP thioesterase
LNGRRFTSARRVRLSDTDDNGRLRLDAVARYLQDVASDDWTDAGFDPDAHVWVVRRTWIEQLAPCAVDENVELATWCSGIASAAAARRYSLRGDRGGALDAESIWIHLDRSLRPVRLGERFVTVYGSSAAGRRAPTRLELPAPDGSARSALPWHVRATDIDRLGHMNNAAYWAPVEEVWGDRLAGRARVLLEYRQPIDREEQVVARATSDRLWLLVAGEVRAAAAILAA